jgi:nucleoside phosphorylase
VTAASNASAIVDQLAATYDESVGNLRHALADYVRDRTPPDSAARANGSFAYPELRIEYADKLPRPAVSRAFARLNQPGTYATSIARPALFRDYLVEQLEHLERDYDVEISVGRSASEIPYAYVIENSGIEVGDIGTAQLSRFFPSNELVHIGDEIADGVWIPGDTRPLALFDGPRTDFSLARLKHYTGTPAEHFQQFVLFTNYIRYVDEFVGVAVDSLRRKDSRFIGLSVPGAVYGRGELADAEAQIAAGLWRRHQMPAYHLMAEGGTGITLVNIGVGPSNAKTICDHVAVLRPHVWLMIGHCGGLRPSQSIGDYVLAHAYLRDDRRRASAGSPAAGHRRGAEGAVRGCAHHHRRGRGQRQAAPQDRHGRHHRRPQLGAALRRLVLALQPEPRGRDRHGIGDGRSAGLSLPRALWDPAMRLRQAAARRIEAAGAGQRLLRAGDQPAFADRDRGAGPAAARRRRPPLAEIAQLRRAAAALGSN